MVLLTNTFNTYLSFHPFTLVYSNAYYRHTYRFVSPNSPIFSKNFLIVVVRILNSLYAIRSPSKALYNLPNTSIIISHWPSARAIMSFVRLSLSDRQYVNNPYGIVTRTPSTNQLQCTRRISIHSRSFDSSVNCVLLYRIVSTYVITEDDSWECRIEKPFYTWSRDETCEW